MNKLFFLTIILAFATIASAGVLGVNFDIIAQALGVFSTEDVELLGCECVDTLGNTIPCDDADSTVTDDPLCPVDLNP